MKIKTISRSEEAETRSSAREVLRVHKNADPKLHPFEKAKEVSGAKPHIKQIAHEGRTQEREQKQTEVILPS